MKNSNSSQVVELDNIKEAGFTHVKWYDEDLNYTYYDAKLNDMKVEVRTKPDSLEWRHLGISMEAIEWFPIGMYTEDTPENVESEILDELKSMSEVAVSVEKLAEHADSTDIEEEKIQWFDEKIVSYS